MRLLRGITGLALVLLGVPAVLAGGVLLLLSGAADPGPTFTARTEPIRTQGHAVVVTDLAALVRAEAPFARLGSGRVRLAARTPEGPAFLGLAPTDQVRRWLAPVPHATLDRVTLARGPLPVRLTPAGAPVPLPLPTAALPVPPGAAAAPGGAPGGLPPGGPEWVRQGTGSLRWSPEELRGRELSLVLMHPQGHPELTLELRAGWTAPWLAPLTWGLLAGGILLVILGGMVLLRPARPREVVFMVEPDQVPVLAGRLGVTSLSGLGAPSAPVVRQLAAVGAAPHRPVDPGLTWPPVEPEATPRPRRIPGHLRPAVPPRE
jgi:hypothetical protein